MYNVSRVDPPCEGHAVPLGGDAPRHHGPVADEVPGRPPPKTKHKQ